MKHKWDEGDILLGTVVSFCEICGGARYRKRVANVDYVNTGGISIDMVGETTKGWKYDVDTTRSCPGMQQEPTP